jgi:hypothetical protein
MHELDMKDAQYVAFISWVILMIDLEERYHEYDFHAETKGMK